MPPYTHSCMCVSHETFGISSEKKKLWDCSVVFSLHVTVFQSAWFWLPILGEVGFLARVITLSFVLIIHDGVHDSAQRSR